MLSKRWSFLLKWRRRPLVPSRASSRPTSLKTGRLGENDLGQRTTISLQVQACRDFATIREWLPGVVILWSNLLPRHVWCWARNMSRIAVARRRLNYNLGKRVVQMGGAVIRHPGVAFSQPALFWGDGVPLSPSGNDILLRDVQQGLGFFCSGGTKARLSFLVA